MRQKERASTPTGAGGDSSSPKSLSENEVRVLEALTEDSMPERAPESNSLFQEPGPDTPSGTGQSVRFSEAERKLAKDVKAWAGIVEGLKRKPGKPQRMLSQTPRVFYLLGADFREVYAAPHVFDGMFPGEARKGHNAHRILMLIV